jgi:hypothetical protein
MKFHHNVPNLDFKRILKIFKKKIIDKNIKLIIYTLDPNDKLKCQKVDKNDDKNENKKFKNDDKKNDEKKNEEKKNDEKKNEEKIKNKNELFLGTRIFISGYDKKTKENLKEIIEECGGM